MTRSLRSLSRTAVAAAALMLALPGAGSVAAQEAEPSVVAYRFWRAPDQTLVEAFATVPWSLLSFTPQGSVEKARFELGFEVRDSAGGVLDRDAWTDSVSTVALAPGSRERIGSTERFSFSLAPGRYTLVFQVRDPESGRVARVEAPITAPSAAPRASDLLLAAELEEARKGEQPWSGSIVRGDLVITPNLKGIVTTAQPRVAVVAEIYRPEAAAAETAQVSVSIRGGGIGLDYRTPPQTRIFNGGGVDAVPVDLTGLPPGEYTVTAEWVVAGDTVRAEHPLRMLLPQASEVVLAAGLGYEELTEAQLDSVARPMRYIMGPEDEVEYELIRDADGKARFLGEFWVRRARQVGVDAVELRKQWEAAVAYVNLAFEPPAVGRTRKLGWETDRGRIYLTHGRPVERLTEAQHRAGTNPWEAWKYVGGRGDKYVFWDKTGFGDYVLVYTTNPNELTIPEWRMYFTREALRRIEQL